jgi:hypothetical protein
MRINYAFIVKLGWHRVPWGRTRRPGGGGAGQPQKPQWIGNFGTNRDRAKIIIVIGYF